jgi:hypothetical protein
MSSFRLSKKSTGRINTVFGVFAGNDLIGSVNVPNAEVPHFLSCWSGPKDSPQPKQTQQSPVNALAAAFMANRRPFSKAAILRS